MKPINFENPESIIEYGFSKPVRIGQLWESGFPEDPDLAKPGVYLVLRPEKSEPMFLSRRQGGHYEDRFRSYDVPKLRDKKWIPGPIVVYIGKAGGPGMEASLKKRLSELVRFGQGKCKTHGGGRAIWQIPEPQGLLICWAYFRDPRAVERHLLEDFKRSYNKLPFANWRL